MKKRFLIALMICMMILLISSCVKFSKTVYETEEIRISISGGIIEITAKKDLTAVEIFFPFSVNKDHITYPAQLIAVNYLKGESTVLAIASTSGNVKKGERLCSIMTELETLHGVEITSQGIVLPEAFGLAVKDPLPNDICVVDTFVRSNSSGSFLIHGKNIIDIYEIALEITYDSEFIGIRTDEEMNGIVVAGSFIGGSHVVTNSTGRISVHSRFTSGKNLEDEDFMQILVHADDTIGKTAVGITGAATNTKGQSLKLVYSNGKLDVGRPVLLGDFNDDGLVDVSDLALFSQRYGQESGDVLYSVLYDIGPAEDYYGGVWTGILDQNEPDGVIGLEDLMVFAKNFSKALPQESNHPPSSPNSPTPANSEIDLPLMLSLMWRCSDVDRDTLTYDVFFGTSTTPPLVKSKSTGTSYRLPALEFGTTYYWKIISYDNQGGTTSGPIWSFTTKNRPSEPDIEWQTCIGGAASDGLTAIELLPNGGYAVAGFTFVQNGVSCEGWAGELLSNGTLKWETCFVGDQLDIATDIRPDFYIFGYTWSSDSDFYWGGGGEYCNSWAIGVSAEELTLGAHYQNSCFGGNKDDYVYDVEGDVYVGTTYSIDEPFINQGGSDLWVGCFSSNLWWHTTFGGTKNDVGYGICRATDNRIVAAGITFSNDGDVSGNHGKGDAWVVKIDEGEGIIWQRCLGGSEYDCAKSIKSTKDGGSVVAGVTCSTDGDVSGIKGNADAWVVKLGIAGEIEWQKCLGGSAYDEAFDILQTPDGGYIVACLTYSSDGDVAGYHGGGDIWVVKLDNIGRLVWQYCLGGNSLDQPARIALSQDNGVVIAGSTLSNDGDVSGNNGGMDMWVVRLGSVN